MNNPDNAPVRPGPNRTTIGVEFEFAAAVAPRLMEIGDPHPQDGRPLARYFTDEESHSARFTITVRNAIIDTLRESGIVAVKSEEPELGLEWSYEFGWTDSLEDDDEKDIETATNKRVLDWVGNWAFDPALGMYQNMMTTAGELFKQFIQFHADNGLELHRTSSILLEEVASRNVLSSIKGASYDERVQIANIFFTRVRSRLETEKRNYEKIVASEIDPISVNLPGASKDYKAWACTVDASVDVEGASGRHYEIPDGSIPSLSAFGLSPGDFEPHNLYRWFSGELRTPILDYNHPQTYPNIQRACAAIRNVYRIHKPMAAVGTGLHVHFGQEGGWTLLHLKKFATLWMLFEQSLEILHRVDRSNYNFYARPLRKDSPIAMAISSTQRDTTHLSNLRNRDPWMADYYMQRMGEHVPTTLVPSLFPQNLKDIIREIWLYDSITHLCAGICNGEDYGQVRFRCQGAYITDNINPFYTQTLEVRLMQGTFDADHIWRWITICYHLLMYARDTSPNEFYNGLLAMLNLTQPPFEVLKIPDEIMDWFEKRLDEQTGYFVYPDKDRVNWAQPFMVPGHAETHG
ncbi:hypothetical protein K449DRAFT_448406 [Hypoxylon sp. EC38]|nr:hypothetical protein K449DRAFT_448406 [Hypoxylon sp. EC38]